MTRDQWLDAFVSAVGRTGAPISPEEALELADEAYAEGAEPDPISAAGVEMDMLPPLPDTA